MRYRHVCLAAATHARVVSADMAYLIFQQLRQAAGDNKLHHMRAILEQAQQRMHAPGLLQQPLVRLVAANNIPYGVDGRQRHGL